MKELYEYVVNFMWENAVDCEESISQSDRIRNLQEDFMIECFKLVKSELES